MNKPKTAATGPVSGAAQEYGVIEKYDVSHVRNTSAGVFFTLWLNGVTINNCKVVEQQGKKDFISLPSYKGNDGKWYSTVWFKFKPEDEEAIIALIEKMLNTNS